MWRKLRKYWMSRPNFAAYLKISFSAMHIISTRSLDFPSGANPGTVPRKLNSIIDDFFQVHSLQNYLTNVYQRRLATNVEMNSKNYLIRYGFTVVANLFIFSGLFIFLSFDKLGPSSKSIGPNDLGAFRVQSFFQLIKVQKLQF